MIQILFIFCTLKLSTVMSSLEEHSNYAPSHPHGLDLIDLGEHIDYHHEIKHDYPAGILLGHGLIQNAHQDEEGIKKFEQKSPDFELNSQIAATFDQNLLLPELPKGSVQFSPSITQKFEPRYTQTPTNSYEVNENTYETKPIPRISPKTDPLSGIPTTTINTQNAVQLGSGSLGVVNLGNGHFALGSGSLGYEAPIQPQSVKTSPTPSYRDIDSYSQTESYPSAEFFSH